MSRGRIRAWLRARLRGLGLVPRFGLLSLIAVVLLGLALADTLQSQIRERALADAGEAADLVARFGIQPQLAPTDLSQVLSPEAVAALDGLLSAGYGNRSVLTLRIWNTQRRVVYSDDHRLIGTTQARDAALNRALAGRRTARVVDRIDGRPVSGRAIQIHVPLRFAENRPPTGAFEIYLSYGPVARTIARDTRHVYLILALGLLLLYAVLYRIAAGASRQLRRQVAANRFQAHHDALTGLPNRNQFYEQTSAAIAAMAGRDGMAAVMIIDLDRFKEVNDTLGHHSGDLLLQQTGDRLRQALRATDIFARLGGDEFAVLLPRVTDPETAMEVAGRIRGALEAPFPLRGLSVHIEASVGIALYPEHGADVDELLQRADVAMYAAKGTSESCCVYQAQHDPYSPTRLTMISQLRAALEEDGLEVHYQPKAVLRSGEISGVEALVRWRHPERGLIAPDDFIPLAEHTGLIKPLTIHVLRTALRQCREWLEAGLDLDVAVNLSARNLIDDQLPDLVAGLLEEAGLEPRRLKLEITESTIMAEPVRARDVLARLHAMGVGLAIDDFGTGYSSLSYLSTLPVSEIKIDRSFVRNIASSSGDAFIVRATIDLGRNLGLEVVAEGVEDEAIWSQLDELGCDTAQGYFLSRPIPAEELTEWLRSPNRIPTSDRTTAGA